MPKIQKPTKTDIVTHLNGLKRKMKPRYDPWNRCICQPHLDVDDDGKITGFYGREPEDGPRSSAEYGRFYVKVLGVEFWCDAGAVYSEWWDWQSDADLEPGESAPSDEEFQRAFVEHVAWGESYIEEFDMSTLFDDDKMEQALRESELYLFVPVGKDPKAVYAFEEEEPRPGFKSISLAKAMKILKALDLPLEMLYG